MKWRPNPLYQPTERWRMTWWQFALSVFTAVLFVVILVRDGSYAFAAAIGTLYAAVLGYQVVVWRRGGSGKLGEAGSAHDGGGAGHGSDAG